MSGKKIGRLLALAVILCTTCTKEHELAQRSYPVVDTQPITQITDTGANLNGEILLTGNSGMSDHGFVYAVTTNPTIEKSDRISLGERTQKGAFTTFANRNLQKGDTYYVKAYAISKDKTVTVYGNEKSFVSKGGSPPAITDFSPKDGVIGDTILMKGSGFSTVKINNIVMLGSVLATVIKSTVDSIRFVLPSGTAVGDNTVSLSVGQFTVNAVDKFKLKALTITSISPTSTYIGDTLTVTGTNFPRDKNLIAVDLLGQNGIILKNTSTSLKVQVNDFTVRSEGPLKITSGLQSVTSSTIVTLKPPLITGFSPPKGAAGSDVTVQGKYFSPIKTNNRLEINGLVMTISEAARTFLKAKVPSGLTGGTYPVKVVVATQTTTSAMGFQYIGPAITGVLPISGTWGTTVTINGENFGPTAADNVVMFDNIQASIVSASATQIKVTVPTDLLTKNSIVSVRAIPVENQTATFATPFTLNAPVISSFTPTQGKANSQVTIQGSNFNPVAGNHTVLFGTMQASVVSATNTTLVVKLPGVVEETDATIEIQVAEQSGTSATTFHTISPWRRVADFPGQGRREAVAFTINGEGYVGLGGTNAGDIFSDTYKYVPATNSWTKISDFVHPGGGSTNTYLGVAAFTTGNDALVGTGFNFSTFETRFLKYNGAGNSWSNTVASLPAGEGLWGAVGYYINGKGYLVSGVNQFYVCNGYVYIYDPITNTWTSSYHAVAARYTGVGFTIGNKAYLTTGKLYPTPNLKKDLLEYDPATDTWTTLAPLPSRARWFASGFAINGKGFLIGGVGSEYIFDDVMKDMWMYDPATDTWTQVVDFPGQARGGAVAFVINGKAYYGTGYGAPAGSLNDFWEFDPSKL